MTLLRSRHLWASCSLRTAAKTRCPSCARCSAQASPIPVDEPVTTKAPRTGAGMLGLSVLGRGDGRSDLIEQRLVGRRDDPGLELHRSLDGEAPTQRHRML